ncbi:hypothetical protein [Alloactinosynnema sp. L-07]|uniref:hypothetical protein n=1 Tax=Alloactinosynnema sp. L-07 TaxID=1653480 RepID=UPI00065EF7AE|nr:hypothetical protein [Alloactinosynnema sp. L-07]CRK56983.1 hypothetical protein [Alloactinosynnema sp. L-07]
MTRHYLTTKDTATADTIWVGYDRRTSSFMSQVYKACDFPTMVATAGPPYETVSHAEDIIAEVRNYAHIPDDLITALEADQYLAPHISTADANAVTYWSATTRLDGEPDTEQ